MSRVGKVVSRGSIRVDARRAVAKLREHMLVDLHLYLHELVRGMIGLGATGIAIDHDAHDVIVDVEGARISPSQLERLLDHVLASAADDVIRPMRLLALGVNAALGLSPLSVDIVGDLESDQTGARVSRIRWTPEALSRELAPERKAVRRPDGLAPATLRLHVRRRLSWGVLSDAARRWLNPAAAVPREVALLFVAAADATVPITVRGHAVQPAVPLLRVPLTPAETAGVVTTRAWVDLLVQRDSRPAIDFLEYGIHLVSCPFETQPTFPTQPLGDVNLPVRVVVDAMGLPTNASRSALRDREFVARVQRVAIDGLREAVRLAKERHDERLVACALGAMVSLAARAQRAGEALSAEAKDLLAIPLLRDATGQPLSYAELTARAMGKEAPLRGPIGVYRGTAPIDAALAPWLGRVVWAYEDERNTATGAALYGLMADPEPWLAQAREAVENREKFYAHTPSSVAVDAAGHLVRESFSFDGGLRGELALLDSDPSGSEVRVFFDERPLCTVSLSGARVPLTFEAAIAWHEELLPNVRHDGVANEELLATAVASVVLVAVGAAEQLAERVGEEIPEQLRPVLRRAIGTVVTAHEQLERPQIRRTVPAALARSAVWRDADGKTFHSLVTLADYARLTAALCYVARAAAGQTAPDGRPLLRLGASELRWLQARFPSTEFVRYDAAPCSPKARLAAIGQAVSNELRLQRRQHVAAMRFGWPRQTAADAPDRVVGMLSVAGEARRIDLHQGKEIDTAPVAHRFGSVVVATDDPARVPTSGWDRVIHHGAPVPIADFELELLTTVVAALGGDGQARARLAGDLQPSSLLSAYLIDSAKRLQVELENPEASEGLRDLSSRLSHLKIVRMLDANGQALSVSLTRVLEVHGALEAIPVLQSDPGFGTDAWRPLRADGLELAALGRWAPFGVHDGAADLERWRERAVQREALDELGKRSRVSAEELGPLVASDAISAFYQDDALGGSAAVAIDRAAQLRSLVELTLDGVPVSTQPLAELAGRPVVARVVLSDESHFVEWRALSAAGVTRTVELIGCAAVRLAKRHIDRAKHNGTCPLHDERVLDLLVSLRGWGGADRADWNALRKTLKHGQPLWPIAQGGLRHFGQLRRHAKIMDFATVRYDDWRGGKRLSELDRPIAYLADERWSQVLTWLGYELRDTTRALGLLQERRAGPSGDEPRLSGQAAHASLRFPAPADLASGEVELIAGPMSTLTVHHPDGVETRELVVRPPLRAALRLDAPCDARTMGAVITRTTLAARRKLRELSTKLDELPPFVRERYCELLGHRLVAGHRLGKEDRSAAVFADTAGRFLSLDTLTDPKAGTFWYTTDPPPHVAKGRRVLRLSEDLAGQLRTKVKLRDMTRVLRREREALARRSAPKRRARLDPELRSACVHSALVSADNWRGEVGVIDPAHAPDGAVEVLHDYRPLCRLSSSRTHPSGRWTLCAVVDADITPNRFFDGIRGKSAAVELLQSIEERANKMLESWMSAPDDALATCWIEQPGLLGRIWLPAPWPTEPGIVAYLPDLAEGPKRPATTVSPRKLMGVTGMRHVVPVGGTLMLAPGSDDDPVALISRVANGAFAEFMSDPAKSQGEAGTRYAWDAMLLGIELPEPPCAQAADGSAIAAADVVAELEDRRVLWLSDGHGEAEGPLPSTASFVLSPSGSEALLDVVRARATGKVLWTLGEYEVVAPVPTVAVEPPAAVADELVESWFDSVVVSVVSWFRPAPTGPRPGGELRDALLEVIEGLSLAGRPVQRVGYARRGRAVRYQPDHKRVVLNREHPVVRSLGSDPANRSAMMFLALAAVSEVNRALEAVTDGEEKRVVMELLKSAAKSRTS